MKYRTRADIMASILDVARRGKSGVQIMHDASLSSSQVHVYLRSLVGNRTVEHNRRTGMYRTTGKGIKFLRTYREMVKIVDHFALWRQQRLRISKHRLIVCNRLSQHSKVQKSYQRRESFSWICSDLLTNRIARIVYFLQRRFVCRMLQIISSAMP